jgi:hypothetical protein
MSDFFKLSNGTRQGGVLSPRFFARYVRDLLVELVNTGIGCNVGGVMINVLAYADDIVLLAPSWRGLQCLLDILYVQSLNIDMAINGCKSVCMIFTPRNRNRIVANDFPLLHVGGAILHFVDCFRYLGHRISDRNSDDDDIQREICSMFVRTNILIRRFAKCSIDVKKVLFRSYCLSLYDAALWRYFTVAKLKRMRSCYNRCIKHFFGFKRRDSLTQVLLDLQLPSFDTVLINAGISYRMLWANCSNTIIKHLQCIVVSSCVA